MSLCLLLLLIASAPQECSALLPKTLAQKLHEFAPEHRLLRLNEIPRSVDVSEKTCIHVAKGDFNGDHATDYAILVAGKPYAKLVAALADGDNWRITELETYRLEAIGSIISARKVSALEHTQTYDFDPKDAPFWVEHALPKNDVVSLGNTGEAGGGSDYYYNSTGWHGVATGC